jgi:UDP-N-acetylmuramoyl-tripeptide--D-alanyl-D-alanine ligase
VVRFEDGFTVINDSYNSSPTALAALAELLAATPGYRRRILAAGEMLELGASAPELHRECGRHATTLHKIDWIFGVQGHAAELVQAAIEAGHPKDRARFFENAGEAAKFISGFIEGSDLLLLKGSRGVRMEKILEAIESAHKRIASKSSEERVEAEQKVKG